MVKQASEFAGTVPVRHLLPYWKTSNRYLFSGGSVNMRDAAVYAKEENWSKAVELWKQTRADLRNKKGKQKMYAAYNTALGYKSKDSIDTALEWAFGANLAREKQDRQKEQAKYMMEPSPIISLSACTDGAWRNERGNGTPEHANEQI